MRFCNGPYIAGAESWRRSRACGRRTGRTRGQRGPGRRGRERVAEWISADGGFANDAFIHSLLSSKAPKLLHEQLRRANYNTSEGEGKASEKSRPKADLTSKNYKSSKTTISEEVVRKHFPKALPLRRLVVPGLVSFLEDEMHFTPRQTLHAHASCANDDPLRLVSNYAACFLGRHFSLSGVAGIPLFNTCRVMAESVALRVQGSHHVPVPLQCLLYEHLTTSSWPPLHRLAHREPVLRARHQGTEPICSFRTQ